MKFKAWFELMRQEAYKNAKYLNTEKGTIHYTDIGDGNVILHSHGSPAGADTGPLFLNDFAKSYRVVTPSRPGFLGTALNLGKSIEEQADFFKEFLDGLNIKKVFLHAWSGGGPPAIAIAFAIKYPQYLHGLILFCAVSHRWEHKITSFEEKILSDKGLWILWELSKIFKTSFRKKSANELGVDYHYAKNNPEALMLLDKFFEMTAPPSLRNVGSYNDIENYRAMNGFDFTKINVPTLILFSPSDNQLPISNGDIPAREINRAQYLRFAHGGHMPVIDKEADIVSNTILKFMENQV